MGLTVAVRGAAGRMGTMICAGLDDVDDLDLVARLGRGDALDRMAGADVVVDVTHREAALEAVDWAVDHGRAIVVGTSGIGADDLARVERRLATGTGEAAVLVVPNFSRAAMLARRFVETAAPFFDFAEIVDVAHQHKVDAPSGTAADLARAIRGAAEQDVGIHSIRMAGYTMEQSVMFGREGEILTIRFATPDREAYLPGVLHAVRAVPSLTGLHVGLAAVYPAD